MTKEFVGPERIRTPKLIKVDDLWGNIVLEGKMYLLQDDIIKARILLGIARGGARVVLVQNKTRWGYEKPHLAGEWLFKEVIHFVAERVKLSATV